MDDQTIRLILDLANNARDVQELMDKLQGLRQMTQQTADTYQVLERSTGVYTVAVSEEDRQLDKLVQSTVDATQAQRRMAQVLDETAQAAQHTSVALATPGGAGGRGGGYGLASGVQQASFAFQDFTSVLGTQGFGRALASVQNNIPILLMSMGAGMGMAGVVSGLAVAAGVLVENWDNLSKAFGTGQAREAIPEATDHVQRLTDSLKKQGEALEELRKKQELTYAELAEYKRLVAETTAAEEDLATARRARSIPGQTAEQGRYAQAFRKAAAESGGSEQLVNQLIAVGMDERSAERLVEGAMGGSKSSIEAIVRKTQPLGRQAFGQFWQTASPEWQDKMAANERLGRETRKELEDRNKALMDRRKRRDAEMERAEREAEAFGEWVDEQERKGQRPAHLTAADESRMRRSTHTMVAREQARRAAERRGFPTPNDQEADMIAREFEKLTKEQVDSRIASDLAVQRTWKRLVEAQRQANMQLRQGQQMINPTMQPLGTNGWPG